MSSLVTRSFGYLVSSVTAAAVALPLFITPVEAAPMAISAGIARQQTADVLPTTDVRYRRYGRTNGAAIGLGVLALGLGVAAIAAQNRAERRRQRYEDYYNSGYYNGGYYNNGYYPNGYYTIGYGGGYVTQPSVVYRPGHRFYGHPHHVYYNHPAY